MDENAAHTSIWRTSDAILALTLLAGSLLEFLILDMSLPVGPPWISISAGVLLIIAGALFIVLARRELNKASQPRAPGQPTTGIVDTGVFSMSRNPIYFGLVLVLPGLGLAFDIIWWIILTIPMVLIMQWALVVPEERYLVKELGSDYEQYTRKVRRWV